MEQRPPCTRCEVEGRLCLRRPNGQGKCLTCASMDCSLFGRGARVRRPAAVEDPARRDSAKVGELFVVLDLHRREGENGPAREYFRQRMRRLCEELGLDIFEIIRQVFGDQAFEEDDDVNM